jgi:hypothetical protein
MGDVLSAQIAQVMGGVVVAAPWELHAFVMPAVMCWRLAAWHGRCALCAGRWWGLAVAGYCRGEQVDGRFLRPCTCAMSHDVVD